MKKFLILLAGGIFLSAWLTSCTEQSPLESQPQVEASVQDATSPGSTVIRGWGRSTVSSVPVVKYYPLPYKLRGLSSVELVTNGGFETDGFGGWTTSVVGAGSWVVGATAPVFADDGSGGETNLHPESLAYTGIAGASMINTRGASGALYQVITLPSGALELKYAIRWKNFSGDWAGLDPNAEPNVLYRQDIAVTLRDPDTDAILATLFQASTENAPLFSGVGGNATTAHYEVHTTDISAYAGQTVRLQFENYAALWYQFLDLDDISITAEESGTMTVSVDIKPGSDTNPINLKSKGVIPVAILSTADFDATTVDGTTVLFAGASPSHGSGHVEDVDGDGDLDWLGHFKTQETNIQEGDTSAGLTGTTTSGQTFQGSDSIQIVKGSSKDDDDEEEKEKEKKEKEKEEKEKKGRG